MTPPIRMVSVPVDELAQEIRRVDGNHSLGAGALAEALLPFLSRFTAAPVREEGGAVEVKPLDWRKPSEFDRDNGHENAELIASGFGGTYAIQRDLANVILWRVDDPFTFDTLPTIEAAKAHAEADWRQTISRKITLATREVAPTEAGECDVLWELVSSKIVSCMKRADSFNPGEFVLSQEDARGLAMDAGSLSRLRAQPKAREEAPDESGERDYPAEFETWWATYRHRNRDVVDYPVKKQIAFDAFYFGARAQLQAREEAQPVADAVEPIERAIAALKGHVSAIQAGKQGGGSSSLITDCINGLPEIVRWIESGLFNVEAAFEQHEDTPPAPEAEKLRVALDDSRAWHTERHKALSKQPPSPDRDWRKAEHAEEIARIEAALQREEQ